MMSSGLFPPQLQVKVALHRIWTVAGGSHLFAGNTSRISELGRTRMCCVSHVSGSKPRTQTHTHIQGQTLLPENEFPKKEENNDDMKDSFTNHFILRSIRTTEHEIMRILLSGPPGIDQKHLDGFACVCVHKKNTEWKCVYGCVFWVCEPICVCGHWLKAEPPVCQWGEEPIDQKWL